MTQYEIKLHTLEDKVNKAEAAQDKASKKFFYLDKKVDQLCPGWTYAEFRARRQQLAERHDNLFLTFDADDILSKAQNEAWMAREAACRDWNYKAESAVNARNELEKFLLKNAAKLRQSADLAAQMKQADELLKMDTVDFFSEMAKLGIKIDERWLTRSYFSGWTSSGTYFSAELNNGWSARSYHCWTLKLGGETLFTSGLLYKVIAVLQNK